MTRTRHNSAHLIPHVIGYLREAHLARGATYLGVAALTMQAFTTVVPRAAHYDMERIHLVVLPITLLVTRGFAELHPEDRADWQAVDVPSGLKHFGQGAGLGAAALLLTLGIARARGWLSAPAWGVRDHSPVRVARSMAIRAVGQIAVAWNEELVFRGYGHTTLARALPKPLAEGILVTLFALAHPLKPRTLAGEAALGMALLALRNHEGGIWMPVGYHWAWNTMQSAVFGPSDGPPSLRPLDVDGPVEWVGRPGHPEPGYLSTLISLGVALGVSLWSRRRRAA
jgi:membrane protease YdiL (CAAX protease family)